MESSSEYKARIKQCERYHEIMRRHVRAEDSQLTDHELVETVYWRWERSLSDALIDPNE